ncbi:MAG TPA: DUF1326 domain-containing protein [Candidatus Krumholzibacteria bacterium]|nr:DUF1326 domain-containing protein [Candidatus Krumholzibacteria bacterium]
MRKLLLVLAAFGVAAMPLSPSAADNAAKDWKIKTTIIEACSCPMFCQCYFNSEPAAPEGHMMHGDMSSMDHGTSGHFCKFNNCFHVDKGKYGNVKLDGAKFWVAGDLGGDFTKGEMEWAEVTFDPSVTPEQREGIKTILGAIYPVKWGSFTVAPDAAMDWTASGKTARAALDGGKKGEVVLNSGEYGSTDKPVVINNLKYWGVPRNDGFVLMKNEVEAYRTGDKAFEYKGTNGFMITFDMSSKDVKM